MNEIEINYEETYDVWAKNISNILEERNIIYDEKMINRIQHSILIKTNNFLISVGYKPKENLSYRKGLIERLTKNGLKLTIQSNRILWKYLEYFLDLEDYTKCFDVSIDINDYEIATKDMIFVSVKQDQINYEVPALVESNHKKINKETLDVLKKLSERVNDEKLNLIIDILDNLVEEED